MFSGFHLNIDCDFFQDKKLPFQKYQEIGKEHLREKKAYYQKELKNYITGKKIDGSKIQAEWFPSIEADIFISHSHEDIDMACALAGWIYDSFDLKCFIDSNVWGYSDELLGTMNDKLSNKRRDRDGGILYDHNRCNLVSQHVNTMLSIALQKMIDKTESVMLLNTEHSIPVHNGNEMSETYSPWIYTEIICTEIVRKKELKEYRDAGYIRHGEQIPINESTGLEFPISYDVSLDHLVKLSAEDLDWWEDKYNSIENYDKYPLDILYFDICRNEFAKGRKSVSKNNRF